MKLWINNNKTVIRVFFITLIIFSVINVYEIINYNLKRKANSDLYIVGGLIGG